MPEARCQHIWDPKGGGPGPCALSFWDLHGHLPPWRPAGPKEGQEQRWALHSRGRKSRAHPSDSILFSQVSLGYSCSQPAPSCPWERLAWFSEPRSPRSPTLASLHFVFIACSHQGGQGGPVWRQDVDPSGNLSCPPAKRPQTLRAHEEAMTRTRCAPRGQRSHVPRMHPSSLEVSLRLSW